MSGWFVILTGLCALGAGLAAGVFFAFSSFVMKGLARLPPGESIKAMNAINVAAVTPLFMVLLFGTAALCLLTVVTVPWRWSEAGAQAAMIGGALYVFGAVVVTMVWNVPLNKGLAAAAPGDPTDAGTWASYLQKWQHWNHARTIVCAGAAAWFLRALWQQAGGMAPL
ncbi:MAG: anthrone oxygenase family protein [Dongiaceae bacterium]